MCPVAHKTGLEPSAEETNGNGFGITNCRARAYVNDGSMAHPVSLRDDVFTGYVVAYFETFRKLAARSCCR